jgi:hypothetical protein
VAVGDDRRIPASDLIPSMGVARGKRHEWASFRKILGTEAALSPGGVSRVRHANYLESVDPASPSVPKVRQASAVGRETTVVSARDLRVRLVDPADASTATARRENGDDIPGPAQAGSVVSQRRSSRPESKEPRDKPQRLETIDEMASRQKLSTHRRPVAATASGSKLERLVVGAPRGPVEPVHLVRKRGPIERYLFPVKWLTDRRNRPRGASEVPFSPDSTRSRLSTGQTLRDRLRNGEGLTQEELRQLR